MEEIFRDIIGYEANYQISNLGTVISKRNQKIMKLFSRDEKGYLYFRASLCGTAKHMSVARCVARAFPEICGEWFEGCTVDHINTIRTDNRAENLRVVTQKENMNNPITVSRRRKGMTDEEWKEYKEERKKYFKKKDREDNKEYYSNYMREYQKTEKFKKYMKEYQKTRYENISEVKKEELKQKSLKYYYQHREEVLAKQRERYHKKKSA